MNSKARSVNQVKLQDMDTKAMIAKLNSRVFLASSQCLGDRNNYLFAFGAEI